VPRTHGTDALPFQFSVKNAHPETFSLRFLLKFILPHT
jgi:hypothetical protein